MANRELKTLYRLDVNDKCQKCLRYRFLDTASKILLVHIFSNLQIKKINSKRSNFLLVQFTLKSPLQRIAMFHYAYY